MYLDTKSSECGNDKDGTTFCRFSDEIAQEMMPTVIVYDR